jgi:hypothetical protein
VFRMLCRVCDGWLGELDWQLNWFSSGWHGKVILGRLRSQTLSPLRGAEPSAWGEFFLHWRIEKRRRWHTGALQFGVLCLCSFFSTSRYSWRSLRSGFASYWLQTEPRTCNSTLSSFFSQKAEFLIKTHDRSHFHHDRIIQYFCPAGKKKPPTEA